MRKMEISVTKQINASIADTFAAFSDFKNMENILDGVTSIEFLSERTSGVGTKWRETREMFGREASEEMEVTEIVDNSHYKVEAESNGVHYESVYRFVEKDGGTEVTMVFSGKPLTFAARIFGAIMGVFFINSTKKALEKDIDDIKEMLEGAAGD